MGLLISSVNLWREPRLQWMWSNFLKIDRCIIKPPTRTRGLHLHKYYLLGWWEIPWSKCMKLERGIQCMKKNKKYYSYAALRWKRFGHTVKKCFKLFVLIIWRVAFSWPNNQVSYRIMSLSYHWKRSSIQAYDHWEAYLRFLIETSTFLHKHNLSSVALHLYFYNLWYLNSPSPWALSLTLGTRLISAITITPTPQLNCIQDNSFQRVSDASSSLFSRLFLSSTRLSREKASLNPQSLLITTQYIAIDYNQSRWRRETWPLRLLNAARQQIDGGNRLDHQVHRK